MWIRTSDALTHLLYVYWQWHMNKWNIPCMIHRLRQAAPVVLQNLHISFSLPIGIVCVRHVNTSLRTVLRMFLTYWPSCFDNALHDCLMFIRYWCVFIVCYNGRSYAVIPLPVTARCILLLFFASQYYLFDLHVSYFILYINCCMLIRIFISWTSYLKSTTKSTKLLRTYVYH